MDAYSRGLRSIGNHFNGKLDILTSYSWSAVKLDLYGLKFFYTYVLNKTWVDLPLIKPPRVTKIYNIVTIEQTDEIEGVSVRSDV